MKELITILLICFSAALYGQKHPIGLIVEFETGLPNTEKTNVFAKFKGLQTVSDDQHLKGFNVSLVVGDADLVLNDYRKIATELEQNDMVTFTSVLYQTDNGTIAGNLPKLYFRPISEWNQNVLKTINGKNLKPHHYLKNVWELELSKDAMSPKMAKDMLLESGYFHFVSINTLHTLDAHMSDPYLLYQWTLENTGTPIQYEGTVGADMEVTDAWDLTTGSETIKIAVLDSGIDTNHIDLASNLLPGFDATGGDSKGYPNTVYSNDSHGTCSAGIISAVGNNEEGVAGVAFGCKLVPVKIFFYLDLGTGPIPFTSSEAGTNGVIWAVNTAKADILSNSWGLRQTEIDLLEIDTTMSNLVIRQNHHAGREGKGVPMLFSSGNEYDDYSIWPASVDVTISVGASSMCDELKSPTDCSPEAWWGSNYGENLDVTAPGVKILSTDMSGSLGYNNFLDDDYAMFNGTSAACPNAAGVMALILSVDPELSAFDARGILSVTAEKVGGYDYDESKDYGLWSSEMGYGRVNAYEAVYYSSYFSGIDKEPATYSNIFYSNKQTYLRLNEGQYTAVSIYDMSTRKISTFNSLDSNETSIKLNSYVDIPGAYVVRIQSSDGSVKSLKAIVF